MKNTWIALVGFLAVATFFLWEDHQAHVMEVLPFALLLLCPVLHLFLHGGHGAHGGQGGGRTSQENPGMEKGQRGEK